MRHYNNETLKNNQATAEAVYEILNKELFNNQLRAYVICNYRRKKLECINVCENIIYTHDLAYGIEVPNSLMRKNNEMIPVWILAQMVLIYGLINNLDLASNNNIYKNKRFKAEAERFGLIVEKHDTYGHVCVGVTPKVLELLRAFSFEKIPHFYEEGITRKKSSTHKYMDTHGNSTRATKDNHIFYCLTDQPDDVVKKVDSYMSSLGICKMDIVP